MSIMHQKIQGIALVFIFSSIVLVLSPAVALADTTGSCTSLRSMARIYMASGRYGKAQPLLEQALHMAQQTSVPESETYSCMLDLAYLYNSQGKLASAETMCRSGLALQQKAYPQNHPYIAYTLRILSEIYRRQARYHEAAEALEQAITIIRDVSRGDDLELAPFKVDMARLLVAQGDLSLAESYFKEAIETIEDSYGPEHLYTTKVLASMAELYVRQKRFTEAETLISRILPIQERIYGPNHYFLVPLWLTASQIDQARGDLMNSKLLLDRSLSAVENHTGPEDLMEVDVRIKLGEFYLSNKEYIKAEGAFQKVLTILESAENPHNDRAAIALNNLAKLYIDQGRYSEAQPLCHRALSLLESNYQNHPSVADVLAVLIQLHHQTGDTIEEAKCKQRLEDIHMQQQATSASVATAME